MSYGSTSFGSAVLGGAAASSSALFSPSEFLTAGLHQRSIEYTGNAEFFEVESLIFGGLESELEQRILRIYSHNDPGETPQLQVTVGMEAFYTQSIVGAARFIVAELDLPDDFTPLGITITGNEYLQNN